MAVDKTACELWLLMEPIRDPIHHAVLTGNHLLVDTLISIGMDINGPNKVCTWDPVICLAAVL